MLHSLTRTGAVWTLSFVRRHGRVKLFNPEQALAISVPPQTYGGNARPPLEDQLDQVQHSVDARWRASASTFGVSGTILEEQEDDGLTRSVRGAATFRAIWLPVSGRRSGSCPEQRGKRFPHSALRGSRLPAIPCRASQLASDWQTLEFYLKCPYVPVVVADCNG